MLKRFSYYIQKFQWVNILTIKTCAFGKFSEMVIWEMGHSKNWLSGNELSANRPFRELVFTDWTFNEIIFTEPVDFHSFLPSPLEFSRISYSPVNESLN